MAYDLFLRKAQYETENKPPDLQIEDYVHEHVFSKAWIRKFRLLSKMSDFYADAFYHVVELDILKSELNTILAQTDDTIIIGFAADLKHLCTRGIGEGKHLCCFARLKRLYNRGIASSTVIDQYDVDAGLTIDERTHCYGCCS